MQIKPDDDIYALRTIVNEKLDAANELISSREATIDEIKALREVARELADFELMLSDAVFLKNTSAIAKLTGEIKEATLAGVKALQYIKDVRSAIERARKAIKRATGYTQKIESLFKEVDGLAQQLQESS